MRPSFRLGSAILLLALLALPAPAHAGAGASPQPVREERAAYVLGVPGWVWPPLYEPCGGVGGACFDLTGEESFIRLVLHDDLSERACADVRVSDARDTQVIMTGGCDVVTVPIRAPEDYGGGHWPQGLARVRVYLRPLDGVLIPDPWAVATTGTVTLHAFE